MERLWTPWRMEYIRSASKAPTEGGDGCIFCDKPAEGDDERTYILARSELAFAMLNAYPYNPGHLMVAPLRHTGALQELSGEELLDASRLLQRAVGALQRSAEPHGFNLGMNLGRVAGAGVPGHLHWHVVPRWNGDTNFMSISGETRVLPEMLAETYARLKPLFA